MAHKHPFSTSRILTALAVAFFAGSGVGYIAQIATPSLFETAVIQRSAMIRRVASIDVVKRPGELIAYHTAVDGRLVDDLVADDLEGIAEEEEAVRPIPEKEIPKPKRVEPSRHIPEKPRIDCAVEAPAKPLYQGSVLPTKKLYKGIPGESLDVTVLIENIGNMPWFSDDSGCSNFVPVQLGTSRERDRNSIFYSEAEKSNWIEPNRIVMESDRVNPGESGVFHFTVNLPEDEDIYREYFTLVMPGIQWIDSSELSVDFVVGQPYEIGEMLRRFNFLNDSSPGSVIDFDAPKKIDVDISDQVLHVKLGDYVIRQFPVSTGTVKNPTPLAKWTVKFKQQWRIAAAHPYYIMPKFMGLNRGNGFEGYGFHALPSLGNPTLRARIRELGPNTPIPTEWFEDDSMWSEARDHIGSRRSHGCIRLLPEDENFLFDFAEEDVTEIVTHE